MALGLWGLPPHIPQPSLTVRKTPVKLKWSDNYIVLTIQLKTVKVIKNKDSLRSYHNAEESK